MSLYYRIAALAALVIALPSPAQQDARLQDNRNRLDIRLRGYHEVPPVSTPAEGRFIANVDPRGEVITFELSYNNLEGVPTMAHVHFGQPGVNGGAMVWVCQSASNPDPVGLAPTCPASGGTVRGLIQAANVVGPAAQGVSPQELAEVVAALRAGVAYVNVHTTRYPAGELRGQIKDN